MFYTVIGWIHTGICRPVCRLECSKLVIDHRSSSSSSSLHVLPLVHPQVPPAPPFSSAPAQPPPAREKPPVAAGYVPTRPQSAPPPQHRSSSSSRPGPHTSAPSSGRQPVQANKPGGIPIILVPSGEHTHHTGTCEPGHYCIPIILVPSSESWAPAAYPSYQCPAVSHASAAFLPLPNLYVCSSSSSSGCCCHHCLWQQWAVAVVVIVSGSSSGGHHQRQRQWWSYSAAAAVVVASP